MTEPVFYLDDVIRNQVLPRFPLGGGGGAVTGVAPFGRGLINATYLVTVASARAGTGGGHAREPRRFVLQRVNPIFPASIHANIAAVTAALARAGMTTPELVPASDGALCVELGAGEAGAASSVWRVLTYIDGASFDVVASEAQARAAGALVARFHRATANLPHTFFGLRAGVHDLPRHLARLQEAVAAHRAHRLFDAVRPLAEEIADAAARLPDLPALPAQVCHGDLKFNNVMFAGPAPGDRERALCLIDLDTVAPMPLAFELGDAWRSWCNRAGEDVVQADLDLGVFRASLGGYREGLARPLSAAEQQALLLGPERISLELGARFAGDALDESYFGWDPARFAGRGEHNLVRARGQWSLFGRLLATHAERAGALSRAG